MKFRAKLFFRVGAILPSSRGVAQGGGLMGGVLVALPSRSESLARIRGLLGPALRLPILVLCLALSSDAFSPCNPPCKGPCGCWECRRVVRHPSFLLSSHLKMASKSPTDLVKASSRRIVSSSTHCKLDEAAISLLAASIAGASSPSAPPCEVAAAVAELGLRGPEMPEWDTETHFFDGGDATVQYLFVLDALNFCFWPSLGSWEYERLAVGLKKSLLEDPDCLSASRLAALDDASLRSLLGGGNPLPLTTERVRLVKEVGEVLMEKYNGTAAELVRQAEGSAEKLVGMVCADFAGFRDHSIYKGSQVFFYKRAQIFVADVWGAFKGEGLGKFRDIGSLTMFADYRVPQILQACGVLVYSESLQKRITDCVPLTAGSEEECEIRACTVQAVEMIKQALKGVHSMDVLSVQIDWYLWEQGEKKAAAGLLPPHHRTLTVYY